MQGLFVRVYAGLVLVLLASIAIVMLLGPSERPDFLSHVTRMSGIAPEDLRDRLGSADDPVSEAIGLARELHVEIKLLPEQAAATLLSETSRRAMASGAPVVELRDHGPTIYIAIPTKRLVAELRPPPPPPPFDRQRALLLAVLTLVGMSAVVVALIRPLERQLGTLVDVAERIGAGELDVRAPVVRTDAAGRLAEAFNGMAEQVEKMVQGRESLMHGVSHELRTPLARLRFALELIELADDAKGRGKRIREAAADVDELEALVRELLMYSKLQGNQPATIATEPTDVEPLLDGLVTDAQRVRPEIELEFVVEGDPGEVPVDAKLFLRAVGNLVNNAMRYADEEVLVTLRRDPMRLTVLVDDDGPGVPEEERGRIFDPFSRLDAARSRDTGGTGLGLPIAAGAAKAHGGSIEVSDSPLGGAQFVWVMPF